MKVLFYLFITVSMIFSESFRGYILDEESGNPIYNVNIIDESNDEIIYVSNIDGYFSFNKEKLDTIILSHIAYKNKSILISDLSN